jgi:hypothetical protein
VLSVGILEIENTPNPVHIPGVAYSWIPDKVIYNIFGVNLATFGRVLGFE